MLLDAIPLYTKGELDSREAASPEDRAFGKPTGAGSVPTAERLRRAMRPSFVLILIIGIGASLSRQALPAGFDVQDAGNSGFPGHSTVVTPGGLLKTVSALAVGDQVLAGFDPSGTPHFAEVVGFGEGDDSASSLVLQVVISEAITGTLSIVQASPGQPVYECTSRGSYAAPVCAATGPDARPPGASAGELWRVVPARDLARGSVVRVQHRGIPSVATVRDTWASNEAGCYSPRVTGGRLFVDGMLAVSAPVAEGEFSAVSPKLWLAASDRVARSVLEAALGPGSAPSSRAVALFAGCLIAAVTVASVALHRRFSLRDELPTQLSVAPTTPLRITVSTTRASATPESRKPHIPRTPRTPPPGTVTPKVGPQRVGLWTRLSTDYEHVTGML